MLEGDSISQLPVIINVNSLVSSEASNSLRIFNCPPLIVQDVSGCESLSYKSNGNIHSKSIYVCTFCQVFSSSFLSLTDHISLNHKDSLLEGTTAENFVSKLQALESSQKKSIPRKAIEKRKVITNLKDEKREKLPDPVPGPDGLYWCEKCRKSFKKVRQFTQHVCLELDNENGISDDSAIDSDESADFRYFMDIEPSSPWNQRPRQRKNVAKLPSNQCLTENNGYESGNVNIELSKEKTNWREDPAYLPLFQNEQDKAAFEKHLKSIDCSFVDNMFVRIESKTKNKKKSRSPQNIFTYSCVVCQKVFNSLSHIRMHCMTHTDIKPFTCTKCPYSTNTKGSLYSHMRTHTGNFFRCSKCDFKATRRTHLIEHEETHSTVAKICKLCKNSYKTVKSLISHVLRYHNYSGGKKYAKSLSAKKPKSSPTNCDICRKKFRSQEELLTHKQTDHTAMYSNPLMDNVSVTCSKLFPDEAQVAQSVTITASEVNGSFYNENSLADIVLNDLLQQKGEAPIELFDDVFQTSPGNILLPSAEQSVNRISSTIEQPSINVAMHCPPLSETLSVCQKTDLDILGECLRESNFPDGMINKPNVEALELPNGFVQPLDLNTIQFPYENETLVANDLPESVSELPNHLNSELVEKSSLVESKSAEIKLFEKCRRAPAYFCCVCSGIFVCPQTLRAHLKQHITSNTSLVAEVDYEQPKVTECDSEIDKILQDSAESTVSGEEELEKLYSSSLDMLFYLRELSVVVENDPSLASIFDELSTLPIKCDEDGLETDCGEIF